MAALLLAVIPPPAAAQPTREEMAAEQRRAKSRELQPQEPGTVERTFLKLSPPLRHEEASVAASRTTNPAICGFEDSTSSAFTP